MAVCISVIGCAESKKAETITNRIVGNIKTDVPIVLRKINDP